MSLDVLLEYIPIELFTIFRFYTVSKYLGSLDNTFSGICAVNFVCGNAEITPRPVDIISPRKHGQPIQNNHTPKLFRFSVVEEARIGNVRCKL